MNMKLNVYTFSWIFTSFYDVVIKMWVAHMSKKIEFQDLFNDMSFILLQSHIKKLGFS